MRWQGTRVHRLVVALAGVGLGVALTAWETEAAAMRTVHDSKNQIAIAVPATWRVQSPNGNAALTATAPVSGAALPDSANVVVHDAPIGMNTPQACENEAAWVTQHFAHITPTTVAKTPVTVGGKPAYAWTYTWTASTGEQRWSQQVCVLQQGTAFVVTGTTDDTPAARTSRGSVLTRIIASLRIVAPPTPQTTGPSSSAR